MLARSAPGLTNRDDGSGTRRSIGDDLDEIRFGPQS